MEVKGAIYNLDNWTWELRKGKRPLRNKPCPCGSNKKYKKCCKENEEYTPKAIHKRTIQYANDFAELLAAG